MGGMSGTVEVYLHDADHPDGPQCILSWPAHVPLPRPGYTFRLPPPSSIGSGIWTVLSVGFAVSFDLGRPGSNSLGSLASVEIDVTLHPERWPDVG